MILGHFSQYYNDCKGLCHCDRHAIDPIVDPINHYHYRITYVLTTGMTSGVCEGNAIKVDFSV